MDQELVQYLDGRFNGLVSELDRRFGEVNERIEEVKRHSGVLIEDLRYQVRLVAESVTMHIQVQHVQEREYFDRKFDETQALFRTTYNDLHQRVENLERKDQN